MAIQKRPYELSIWVERLNGSNSKIEEKGAIIGAHDMSYPGRATKIVLRREVRGTNTLTFQMPDVYFDSLTGEYVRNEFIDLLSAETKLKLFYKNRWFEFFVKKIDEKKVFKSYMKSFTCTDAFIDELSRNGYGITYDTDLYNNVEEIGTFTEETLEDSIWQYYPENNWGDFTEYKEEKLYKIPVSCFGGTINGYRLNFELSQAQLEKVEEKHGTNLITNPFTEDQRLAELSDDMARNCFWDEYRENDGPDNLLTQEVVSDIPNDGYIYVPYSCLGFCYGSDEEPDFTDTLKYDRAATETAISVDGKLALAPQSVDPRTAIQFYAFPKNTVLEIDDAGVILNKDHSYFMTLSQWNRAISSNYWYMFEDTRLVEGEMLGSTDVANPTISHTFKYLLNAEGRQILNTDYESRGNKIATYEGYLCDVNNIGIIKGKKFSITDRTEVNISKDIDQYAKVYNCHADDFIGEYTNEDWNYEDENRTTSGEQYRVCSKIDTRQIIPQLARNLVQNGTDMDSVDGWSPMDYLHNDSIFLTPALFLRGVQKNNTDDIYTSAIEFSPAEVLVGQKYIVDLCPEAWDYTEPHEMLNLLKFSYNGQTWAWNNNTKHTLGWCGLKQLIQDKIYSVIHSWSRSHLEKFYLYSIGTSLYFKDEITPENPVPTYRYFCDKNDFIYKGMTRTYSRKVGDTYQSIQVFKITEETENGVEYCEYINSANQIEYKTQDGTWNIVVKPDGDSELAEINLESGEVETTTGDRDNTNGYDIVNFGIIGQEKKIEKDKTYCLGVSAWALQNFTIKIGKGTLISDGKYTLVGDTTIEFNVGTDIDYDFKSEYPTNMGDERKNLVIEDTDMPAEKFILFKTDKDIENPYFLVSSEKKIVLLKLYLFEAYTKGMDCFPTDQSSYRYSGRDLFWPPKNSVSYDGEGYKRTGTFDKETIRNMIIFEDQIMLGTTYGYQKYYIQRLKTHDGNTYDTMGKKNYISSNVAEIDGQHLPLDAAAYTDDDYTIETNYIDLNKCQFYDKNANIDQCDCKFGDGHTCFYQKFGYCPFRFKTEKHDRRVRTLSINKSNRFNIIQEISKVFEVYPQFWIDHKQNGSVVKDKDGEDGKYLKKVFFITEKGKENKLGFRYEKNLKDISRNIASDKIVSKLYVLDVDSDLSKTGLCSIKTAEDNPSKDSYIIDLSYYIEKGMLDGDEVEQDLYGKTPNKSKTLSGDEIPSGFLYQLGYYNQQYDDLSNKIINLQDASYTELEANLTVNYEAIHTAQEQLLKIKKQLDKYISAYTDPSQYINQQVYLNYLTKLSEQQSILTKLIYSTFYTDGICDPDAFITSSCFSGVPAADADAMDFFNCIIDLDGTKDYWINRHNYNKGILGQFNREFLQIQQWKRERASYLKLINQISTAFYKKYEPYLKEGTWSDSNYLTDNAYYFGALDVAAEGALPKVSYNISVIDLSPINEEYEENFNLDLADITYVEDLGMFGINKHTGLPNRLKVLVSEIQEGLDDPSNDTITVQNFTTAFDDLFQQITASVQNLTFNENIYRRSSNFTSLQNISTNSLQGALDTNDLILLDTDENNIKVDNSGTSGSDINNHANKYRLNGQGLFFSNDGGQHWSVGVGPSGINADYIKVGTLDAGKIRIADSAYVYFSWDKDGITAYRDPQAINTTDKNAGDAAIFNKYGLSIVNNGHIKLRTGYEFNGENGIMSTETQVGDNVGFYLYNNEGNVIFSTSQSSDNRQSATLQLTGEMMVSNTSERKVNENGDYKNKYLFINGYYKTYKDKIMPDIHSTTILDEGTQTYIPYFDATSYTNFTKEQIAAYLFYNEPTLSTLRIKSGSTIVDYDTPNIGTSGYAPYHYMTTNRYQLTDTVNEDITVSFNGNTIVFWKLSTGKSYFDTSSDFTNALLYSNIDDTAHIEGQPITVKTAIPCYVYDGTSYNYSTDKQGYNVNGEWYQDLYGESGAVMVDSSVGLYLNNPAINPQDATGDINNPERLFVCCAQAGDDVNNLFAVLKDGTAYFGGKIAGESFATELSDRIRIDDAGIKITANGELIINFNGVKSPSPNNPNEMITLVDYIAQTLDDANSPIKQKIDEVYGDLSYRLNELNGVISSIGGLEQHTHYLDTPTDVGYHRPGDPAGTYKQKNVGEMWIPVYAQPGDCPTGDNIGRIKIGDIFSVGGIR